LEEPDLAERIAVLLGVIARDVGGVKVLPSSTGSLAEQPTQALRRSVSTSSDWQNSMLHSSAP
jgi:hypothetical protein